MTKGLKKKIVKGRSRTQQSLENTYGQSGVIFFSTVNCPEEKEQNVAPVDLEISFRKAAFYTACSALAYSDGQSLG